MKSSPAAWKRCRADFVNKYCALSCLQSNASPDDAVSTKAVPYCVSSVCVPIWIEDDFVWENHGRSCEFRVDNSTLASWLSGTSTFDPLNDEYNLSCIFTNLQFLVQDQHWNFRWKWLSWVTWIPRERNALPDHLCNLALDLQMSFHLPVIAHDIDAYNFVVLSDGAARGSSGDAASAWVIVAMRDQQLSLVSGGAELLPHGTSSLHAEARALDLAVHALLRITKGLLPHGKEEQI